MLMLFHVRTDSLRSPTSFLSSHPVLIGFPLVIFPNGDFRKQSRGEYARLSLSSRLVCAFARNESTRSELRFELERHTDSEMGF